MNHGSSLFPTTQCLYSEMGEHPLSVLQQVLCLQLYCRLQSMPNIFTHATVMNRSHDDSFSTLKYHVSLAYTPTPTLGRGISTV